MVHTQSILLNCKENLGKIKGYWNYCIEATQKEKKVSAVFHGKAKQILAYEVYVCVRGKCDYILQH